MKVNIIKLYYDRRLARIVKVGEELTVDDKRGEKLIKANVAQEIQTQVRGRPPKES